MEIGGLWELLGKKDESTFFPEAVVSVQLQRASTVAARHHFSYSHEMMDGLNPFPNEDFMRKAIIAISFFSRVALKDRLKKLKKKKKKSSPPHLPMHQCGDNFVRLEFKTKGREESELLHHKLYLFCGESTAMAAELSFCFLTPPSCTDKTRTPEAHTISKHF